MNDVIKPTIEISWLDLRKNLPTAIDFLRKMADEESRPLTERYSLEQVVIVLEQVAASISDERAGTRQTNSALIPVGYCPKDAEEFKKLEAMNSDLTKTRERNK